MQCSVAGLILISLLALSISSTNLETAQAAPVPNTTDGMGSVSILKPRIKRLHGYGPHSHLRYRRFENGQTSDTHIPIQANSGDVIKHLRAEQSMDDSAMDQRVVLTNDDTAAAILDEMQSQDAHLYNRGNNEAHTETLPVVALWPNSTHIVSRGRTSEGSGRSRPINPIVATEASNCGTILKDDDDFMHFSISDAGSGLQRRSFRNSDITPNSQITSVADLSDTATITKAANVSDMFIDMFIRNQSSNASSPASISYFRSSAFNPRLPYHPSVDTSGYSDILSKNYWFYQVQRSGTLQQSPRSIAWRNDSALSDGSDNGLDLTGGYYDAGDYLKFTHPLSYALTMLASGSLEYSSALSATANLGYADETLRWGLDWLIKAHPDNNTLYVQVGDGDVDNDYWGGDQTIPTPRPSFAVNREKSGTDVTAGAAAAFAAGALFYSTILPEIAYGRTLLSHALSLFYLAESAPRRLYQTSVPAVREWYASTDYSDELCLAALLLYQSTDNVYFLKRAEAYFEKYNIADNADPLDWDSKHGLCMMMGTQLLQEYGVNSSVHWRSAFEGYLDKVTKAADRTQGGLLWWDGSSDTDSLSHAMSVTYLLDRYTRMFPNTSKSIEYRNIADDQIDYVFGKNPRQATYVVGVNEHSPKNPQSAMASGGSDIGKVDTIPKVMLRTLFGAMVGGPAKDDSYEDRRSNWKQSECALDYNAALTAVLLSEIQRGRIPYFMRATNDAAHERMGE